MNSKYALALVLVVSIYMVGSTSAWAWTSVKTTKGSSGNNGTRRNDSRTSYNVTISVRRVDEEHPYFRSYSFGLNSTTGLSDFQRGLRSFFNTPANFSWIVKNDHLLVTKDFEVRQLKNGDRLEVWFAVSGAPTRAKTVYTFSKSARKSRWSDSDDNDKSSKSKDKTSKSKSSKSRSKKRRSNSQEEDFDSLDFDSF